MSVRRSKEEWGQILESYASRSGSKKEFCREHGVKDAALSYQLERRTRKTQSNFSVAQTKPRLPAVETTVEFPSGIRLRISG